MRKLKEFIRNQPERIEDEYIARWEEFLTEGEDRPWAWKDAEAAIDWGARHTLDGWSRPRHFEEIDIF